ncbi:MAG: NYN domain-containing protein [Nitrospiraceae bacterium]|nr:NYN domain-containing protein [Nitrospiraceae bacterium]
MPTHLIIDGYNLLGRVGALSGPMEPARELLLQALAEYRQRKLHPITVVFDGWKQRDTSERREHRAGVLVVYSKRGERADQVIQRLAREYGADAAVVTSDGEVARSAQASGAFVMGAQEFALKLWAVPASGGPHHKELDGREDDSPARDTKKKGNPRKLPKARRARARQLKRF